jgi:hypothetical protein
MVKLKKDIQVLFIAETLLLRYGYDQIRNLTFKYEDYDP